VIVRLSNGDEKQFSTASGTAKFTSLADNTVFSMELIGITENGIDGSVDEQILGSAQCRTREIAVTPEPEPLPENETKVSSITGASTIFIGDTPTYSIMVEDTDGIASVTATLNGNSVTVDQSGNQYSVALPNSATASAGSLNLEFSVIGELANGGNDVPVVRSQTIDIEPVISSPMINSIGSWNIQDNGGGLPSSITLSGSGIQVGAVFSLATPITGLSIDEETGEIIFNMDIVGTKTFNPTARVVNPDGGQDTETFILNVEDNF
jgi:hypothetical protein